MTSAGEGFSNKLALRQLPRRSNRGLCLGDPALRRRVGWHRPDHLVLVLAFLQYRHVLSSVCDGASLLRQDTADG